MSASDTGRAGRVASDRDRWSRSLNLFLAIAYSSSSEGSAGSAGLTSCIFFSRARHVVLYRDSAVTRRLVCGAFGAVACRQ